MRNTARDMLGGFVNGQISPEVFEKHLYACMSDYETSLDKETFDMLLYADYKKVSDTETIKRCLREQYLSSVYNADYFKNTDDEELKKAYSLSHPDLTDITFELANISDMDDLHSVIKKTLGFDSSYGRNFESLENMIDLKSTKNIIVNGYSKLYSLSRRDALIFVWLLGKKKNKDCMLTVNN